MGRETDLDDARPPADPEQVGPGIEVLAREECLQLLRRTSVGRLAFVAAGWPIALPVNYSFDGEDLVVRTDPRSQLARATRHAIRVAREIDETRSLYQSGWSVVAFGMAQWVDDDDEAARLSASAETPWVRGPRTHVVRITLVQLSGRRVQEHGRYPNRWS